MTRLLIICHGFPPYYGGGEHAAYYLAREAAREPGHAVTVLTSDLGGRLPREEEIEGMRVVRVPARKTAWTHHTVGELASFYFSARTRLADVMASSAPDHVLAFFAFPEGELARLIHRRWRVPYTVVLQGSDVPGYQPRRFALLYPFLRPVVRRTWRAAAHVVAVSNRLRDLALETWPDGAVSVIENGVDTELFRPAAPPRGAAPGGPLRAVVVAQLIQRKGIQYLVEAVGGLRTAGRDVQVEVYGSGPYEPELKDRVRALGLSTSVAFRGLTTHNELPRILREADVFVLPSLQEGLPLALLEALASGLPAVATRVGGIPTLLRDGVDGLLVDPADAGGLRAALQRLLDDGDLRQRLRAAARAAAERFSWRNIWRQYRGLPGLSAGR